MRRATATMVCGRWTQAIQKDRADAGTRMGRAQGNGVDLSSGFLSDLHRAIAAPLGVRTAREFSNGTFPGSWTYFADALTDLLSEDVPLSEHAAWIVSQISQELDGKFIEYLRDAGPDPYDAENL